MVSSGRCEFGSELAGCWLLIVVEFDAGLMLVGDELLVVAEAAAARRRRALDHDACRRRTAVVVVVVVVVVVTRATAGLGPSDRRPAATD